MLNLTSNASLFDLLLLCVYICTLISKNFNLTGSFAINLKAKAKKLKPGITSVSALLGGVSNEAGGNLSNVPKVAMLLPSE